MQFPERFLKFIEESKALKRLELLCSYECELKHYLEELDYVIQKNNWDITFLYHIKSNRMTGNVL